MVKPKNTFEEIARKRILILISLFLTLLMMLFINNSIAETKNIKTVSYKPNEPIHIAPIEQNINSIENKINDDETNTDPSLIDVYKPDGRKIAYLTFDDGPSPNITPRVLSILNKNCIKATFFLIGSMAAKYPNLVKQEVSDKQSIGNHTYSHDYKYVYSSTKAFINDINKCEKTFKAILGDNFNTKLIRFPGGSSGSKFAPFREAIKKDGYHYIDWNDLTGDAEGQNIPVDKLVNNLKKYTQGKDHVVILMHDSPAKETTVQALPEIINYLKSQDYSFGTLK